MTIAFGFQIDSLRFSTESRDDPYMVLYNQICDLPDSFWDRNRCFMTDRCEIGGLKINIVENFDGMFVSARLSLRSNSYRMSMSYINYRPDNTYKGENYKGIVRRNKYFVVTASSQRALDRLPILAKLAI